MGKRAIPTSLVSAAVVASMVFATPAWATIEGDQTPASDEEVAAAIASGEILTEDPNEGSEESGISLMSAKGVYSPVSMTQMAGATMYETAVAEAKAAYSSSPTVVLAGPEDAWTDALSAAGLAGCLDCPILFTYEDTLHPATRQALKDLGAQNVIIVGGPEAISTSVESRPQAAGISLKARLGGRTATARRWRSTSTASTTGCGPAAPRSSPPAAGSATPCQPPRRLRHLIPIFLSRDGGLDSAQRKASRGRAQVRQFSSVVMVGGPDAISQATGDSLQKAAQAAGGIVHAPVGRRAVRDQRRHRQSGPCPPRASSGTPPPSPPATGPTTRWPARCCRAGRSRCCCWWAPRARPPSRPPRPARVDRVAEVLRRQERPSSRASAWRSPTHSARLTRLCLISRCTSMRATDRTTPGTDTYAPGASANG